MSESIHIKNQAFSLPVIEVIETDIDKIMKELKGRIAQSDSYSIPCVLAFPNQVVEPTFMARLVEILRQVNLQVVGVQTEDMQLSEHASYAGLTVFDERLNQYDLFHSCSAEMPSLSGEDEVSSDTEHAKDPLIHQGSVTSGEQIYAEGRDLVVLGDVFSDAEVIADGNIYIGGTLQGRAYAGNSGLMNIDEVCVRAYCFEPELISICGFYQLNEDIPAQYLGLAIKASFKEQKMQFDLE